MYLRDSILPQGNVQDFQSEFPRIGTFLHMEIVDQSSVGVVI